eukprot:TRINITY_DN70335_c0_g1_i1.p2 TRINITY_DN70335_c0_g1~~TRINITY_DN70335_c0_g1_i1.p2  ORF type:complete len:151 (-),score=4.79 TRINITY_DN70335_c0_g1_i1:474-926(-)
MEVGAETEASVEAGVPTEAGEEVALGAMGAGEEEPTALHRALLVLHHLLLLAALHYVACLRCPSEVAVVLPARLYELALLLPAWSRGLCQSASKSQSQFPCLLIDRTLSKSGSLNHTQWKEWWIVLCPWTVHSAYPFQLTGPYQCQNQCL